MNRINMRFYFIFLFILIVVAAVGYITFLEDKESAENIEFYYSELISKDVRNSNGEIKYIFKMKLLYKDSDYGNEISEDKQYEVNINPDNYKGYGEGSILKSYFDKNGKLYLAGISLEEPYEGWKPH